MSSSARAACTCLIMCGPSGKYLYVSLKSLKISTIGVGKGTLCNYLLSRYPQNLALSVSHTTRKPRFNEINGVHYHFVGNEV